MNEDAMSDALDPPFNGQSRAAPLIERAPLPMLEVEGAEHTICFVNAPFCRLVKKEREGLLGKRFSEIVFNGAKCVPVLDRIYNTGESETMAERDHSEFTPAYWLYAMWPTLDDEDRPVGVVIQLTRSSQFRQNTVEMNEALLVSGLRQHELREEAEKANAQLQIEMRERERVEHALRIAQAELRAEADKLEARVHERTAQLRASIGELEAFSYSLVHDLRAPVRAIHGFAHLALEMSRDEVGPSAAELLRRVVKAAVRMDSLIRDVLSLNEVILKPVTRESVDVETLIRTLIDERPELSVQHAEITIETPLLRMCGHEASLGQCISNLLNNAVKFVDIDARPRVKIWTEEIASKAIENPSNPESAPAEVPRVRLWIEDYGIGIDRKDYERIFQIFQRLHSTTQYEGTGIGLAIVRKAIERMGGTAGLDSVVGQGSRFWLELPRG